LAKIFTEHLQIQEESLGLVETITEELLKELYDQGVTDVLVFSPYEVETFQFGKG